MRDEIGETEQRFRRKVTRSTDKLLGLLQAMHTPEAEQPQPEPEPEPEVILPQIHGFSAMFSPIGTIQRAVLVFYPGVSLADIKGPCRTDRCVRPRQLAMYLSRTLIDAGWRKIGRGFGNRDHSTVIHAVRKMSHLCKTDPQLAAQVRHITDALGEAQ